MQSAFSWKFARKFRKLANVTVLVTLVVTLSRRSLAMVVRPREGPVMPEGVRKMIKGTADESSVKRAALFAYAAGATGILANPLLIAFYALQASHPEDGTSLGTLAVS